MTDITGIDGSQYRLEPPPVQEAPLPPPVEDESPPPPPPEGMGEVVDTYA